MTVNFAGNPVELKNAALTVGATLPDFKAVDGELNEKTLADFPGKKIILTVPSLDTPVCDMEVRRFNKEIESLKGFTTLAVSMDLPFAQGRWCAAAEVSNVVALSDFRYRDVAYNYGVYIEGVGLCARAVFVADENNKITYVEYVSEVTEHPDYDKALEAAKAL